jgi:hypothetical protein
MEVGKGLVYLHQTLLDDVHIDASTYDVVKVDMVHENAKNMKLEVPPVDTMLTLRDAITRRVQWIQTYIDVAVASTWTTTSQSNSAPGSIFPETTGPDAVASVSNSRAVMSVFTSDLKNPTPYT